MTITEEGSAAGPKTVVLTVADDQGAETRGELIVNVQEAGNLPPVANGDLFLAHPGETLTLDPLKNDTDPNGDPLMLAAVSGAPSGASITPDLERGTIDFVASSPGSYSFAYTVSDGVATTLRCPRLPRTIRRSCRRADPCWLRRWPTTTTRRVESCRSRRLIPRPCPAWRWPSWTGTCCA